MFCPNCGTENKEGYQFCLQCGTSLAAEAPQTGVQPPTQVSQPSPYQPPSYPQPTGFPRQEPSYGTPPYAQPYQGMTRPALAMLNIWGPFAGYGTRRSHKGWLMDGRGERAADLTQEVGVMYRERQIPGATFQAHTLTAGGVLVEQRPYFILKRGLTSVALNISQFGKDLFVSIAAYLKPPISNFRVIIVLLMILFAIFTVCGLSNSLVGTMSSMNNLFGRSSAIPSLNSAFFMLCVIGPLGVLNMFALQILFIFSCYKWFKEKDFLAALRIPPNEFNEDDLMAMEKATEQTVLIALDKIGLDPKELKPIITEDRLRLI